MKAQGGLRQVKVTLCLIPLFLLGVVASAHGRQLFYILDRISTPDGYLNEIKCFDLNGVFQYKLFEVDPWKWYDYTCIATNGRTAWLGGGDLGVDSFAIRPGGVSGFHIPYVSGSYSGMALGNNSLWVSNMLTWGSPYGRIDVYSTNTGGLIGSMSTLSYGFYPNSMQMVGATLLIKDGQHDDKVHFIDTGSEWVPYGPLILTGAPLSARSLAADESRIWLLGYSGGQWTAVAFDWSGNRQPGQDAPFTHISQPLDMYMAWGPDEPVASISPLSLDFGTLLVGQTADLSARIENIGNDNLLLTNLELTDADNFWQSISPGSLPTSYTPGGFVSFVVRFQPQSDGDFNEDLIIRTNDAREPEIRITLSGRAVPNVWYVDPEVEGGDGTSWESAFSGISQALSDSRIQDGAEIRIRGGEYHDTIEVNKSVSLIGGFDEEGNLSGDGYYPYINGHGSSIPLKITASNVTVEGFDIENGYNHAVYPCRGGGIDIVGDNVTIANCWIGFNRAQYGGGIGITGSSNTIRDCCIEGNESLHRGGGVFISGGSDNQLLWTEVVDNRCTNQYSSGGGVYNETGPLTLVDCAVFNNRAESAGGIMSNYELNLTNCLVSDNQATANEPGAGICCGQSMTVVNCTIVNNRINGDFPYGAGLYTTSDSVSTVTNCIVWGNNSSIGDLEYDHHQVYPPDHRCVVSYSNVQDAVYGGLTGEGDANHNIRQDPRFIDPNAEDVWDRDYWLHDDSPCIDSGTAAGAPDHDLEGTARPYGSGFDMGALEWVWRYPGPWYVDADASEGGDGQSWAQASQSINDALEEADDDHEIWVKAGTYHLGEYSLWIGYDVLLLGGFAGSETDKSQRDPDANPTVIDGDNDGGCMDVMADAVIDGFTITNANAGGGGGMDFFDECSPIVSNCVFVDNRADIGGAMLVEGGSSPLIIDCVFLANVAREVGGGIDTDDGAEPILVNCLFVGNSAGHAASALCAYHGFVQAYNCTFADNVIGSGDHGGGAVAAHEASLFLDGCIVWGNTGPENLQINIGEADVTIRYCSIDQDGFEGSNGNVRRNPLFASTGQWDDNGTPGVPQDDIFIPGDYHLQSTSGRWDPDASGWVTDIQTSLCIDAGNPGMGTGQETAPHGDRGNLGAYGRTVQASRSPDGWAVAGDLNNDGATDAEDLAVGLDDWLNEDCDAEACPMDLNGDGQVNMADYAILAETWLARTVWL